jgi:hypothetical protein
MHSCMYGYRTTYSNSNLAALVAKVQYAHLHRDAGDLDLSAGWEYPRLAQSKKIRTRMAH